MPSYVSPEVITAIGIGAACSLVWAIKGLTWEIAHTVGRCHDRLSEIVERLDAMESRLQDIDGRLIMMEPRIPPSDSYYD